MSDLKQNNNTYKSNLLWIKETQISQSLMTSAKILWLLKPWYSFPQLSRNMRLECWPANYERYLVYHKPCRLAERFFTFLVWKLNLRSSKSFGKNLRLAKKYLEYLSCYPKISRVSLQITKPNFRKNWGINWFHIRVPTRNFSYPSRKILMSNSCQILTQSQISTMNQTNRKQIKI